MMENYSKHWEEIYQTKRFNEVSSTQELPKTSLDFIHSLKVHKSAAIMDVGGGDSKLVDHLLDEGFENITVLDISKKALEHVKTRLGEKSTKVKWVVSDVTVFKSTETYDVWLDRATFHYNYRISNS